MTSEELADWWWNDWPSCGCGDPEAVVKLIRDVLDSFSWNEDNHPQGQKPDEAWEAYWLRIKTNRETIFGAALDTACMWQFLYLRASKDLTEHGGGAASSWYTKKGKEILAALNEHGTNPDTWRDAP
jgi:hypothetical protein